jgi:N-methylhydantoinase A
VAKELFIPRVIVPPVPGMFCALGMLVADLRHDYVQTYLCDLKSVDMNIVLGYLLEFQHQAEETLLTEGAYPDTISYDIKLDLRYQGQNHVLSVPVTFQELEHGDCQTFIERYDRIHQEYYDQSAPGEIVELVNLRLVARGRSYKGRAEVFPTIPNQQGSPEVYQRQVYWGLSLGRRDTAIYRREQLGANFHIEGPAIVEEWASTTALYPGDSLTVDRFGNLIVEVG